MTPHDDPEKRKERHRVNMVQSSKPITYAIGNTTAQSCVSTCHPTGTMSTLVLSTTIPAAIRMHNTSAIRKRRHILGTSRKKLERSTSFLVAPHEILYENRWARSATERWMLRPPKKKKLWGRRVSRNEKRRKRSRR